MTDDIIKALRNGQQYDQDGVRCIVSRQACHEAADIVAASHARIAELKAALEEIGHMGFDMPATLDLTDDAWRRRRTGMMQHIAREALKAKP
jgi:hypothetical protein